MATEVTLRPAQVAVGARQCARLSCFRVSLAGPRIVDSPAVRWLRSFLSVELLDNRYPSLHGLRVLAIVSVVQLLITMFLEHKPGMSPGPGLQREASKGIFFGMDLFFVLL